MQKMLLHGKALSEVKEIKDYLESRLPYPVELSSTEQESLNLLQSRAYGLFLCTLEQYGQEELAWVREIRAGGFSLPILVLAKDLDPAAMKASIMNERVHFTEKPFELTGLRGLVMKLIKQRNIPQQQYKRFRTNQKLAIESYSTGEVIESSMYNLSVGGAYFESTSKCQASIGELLKMSVNLSDVSSSHLMNARVIWTTKKGTYSGGYGMGVKFVKNEEVYKQLLGDD